jgi:hypothetical protein
MKYKEKFLKLFNLFRKKNNSSVDEYIVYIYGDRYYYKNKKLHRENGPAFVPEELKEEYTGLGDDDLYVKIFMTSKKKFEPHKIKKEYNIEDDRVPHFFLEGVKYESQKEINAFKLNQELNNELPTKLIKINKNNKKLKI